MGQRPHLQRLNMQLSGMDRCIDEMVEIFSHKKIVPALQRTGHGP